LITYLDHLPATAELIIVGGGVVGAASAFYAAEAGFHPLLLERRARLCSLTTAASTGAFRLQFDNLEELEIVRESAELFLHFAETTRQNDYDLGVRQQGYLWLTTCEDGVRRQRRLVRAQHAWGQTDIELLDADETRRRFPFVGNNVLQARFRQSDGFLDPKQLTMGLAATAGTSVLTYCPVTGFRIDHGRIRGVVTQRGTIETDLVIIAAGPFSGELSATAGVQLPIRTVVRQKLILPTAPEVPAGAPMTIDDDTGAHWRPALQGAYVLFTDPTTAPTPPTENITPDHSLASRLLDPDSSIAVARVAPFWQDIWERNSANWLLQGGQYTMTPDRRPLLGGTQIEGLFVNTGYSGHGIMGSPAGSRLLIDVLSGRLAPDNNPFRLDRTFAPREHDIL
jgi:sarcosine oxidase, subunit beta